MYNPVIGRWISPDPLGIMPAHDDLYRNEELDRPSPECQSEYTCDTEEYYDRDETSSNYSTDMGDSILSRYYYSSPADAADSSEYKTSRWNSPLDSDRSGVDYSNLYRYAFNSPTNASDPSGLDIRIYYTSNESSGYYHVDLVWFDPLSNPNSEGNRIAWLIGGRGPSQAQKNSYILVTRFRLYSSLAQDATDPYLGRLGAWRGVGYQGNDPSAALEKAQLIPNNAKYKRIDTGSLSSKDEMYWLEDVSLLLRQVPFYKTSGPNSNSYTSQLLFLASERDSQIKYPATLVSVPGWNDHGRFGYGGPTSLFNKWGRPIAARIAAYEVEQELADEFCPAFGPQF